MVTAQRSIAATEKISQREKLAFYDKKPGTNAFTTLLIP
jgi:hypothetical protein